MVKNVLKKYGLLGILLVFCLFCGACGRTCVEPGHVGIRVNSYGEDRGVSSYPITTGVVWYNPISTSILEYPTFVQNAVWTKDVNEGKPLNEEITFTTGDQMKVDADISLAYHLVPEKILAFYVKFRSDDLSTFTHGFLRNLAREKFDNIAGKYKIEVIMGDNGPFLDEVRTTLQKELNPIGVILDQFGFIGAPRPPKEVIDAINAKVKATQDAIATENQIRQVEAQAKKNVAEAQGAAQSAIVRAEAAAKANQLLSSSLTQNLIEWQKLQVQQQAISKWNGTMPQYNGTNVMPFVQLPQK